MSLYSSIKEAFQAKDFGDLQQFFPQFRLEGRARDADNDDSLAMRIHDPLWTLGRQWQLGEFVGEDNGSPISAQANYYKTQTNACSTINGPKIPLDAPLEVLVEAMAITPNDLDLRNQVKTGEQLERILLRRLKTAANSTINTLRTKFPFNPSDTRLDGTSKRFCRLMRGKVINGAVVLNAIQQSRLIETTSDALLKDAFQEFLAWFRQLYQQVPEIPAPTGQQFWNPSELIHSFKVYAPGKSPAEQIVLEAPDYQSGDLDWYSFDKAKVPESELNPLATPQHIPANLKFAGMPNKRLFAFEDNYVDLGTMDIQDDDLLRMMLLDFSLYSGSDWYSIPMELELGGMCWINYVSVTDVFGVVTKIANGYYGRDVGPALSRDLDQDGRLTGLDVWDVFKIRNQPVSMYKKNEHFLYVIPSNPKRQESEALEEILFVRDEFANQAWAIEKSVLNPLGNATDAYDLHLELNGPFIPLENYDKIDPDQLQKYRLANTVPFNWIPYIPTNYERGFLRRAYMVSNKAEGILNDIEPLSYLAGKELLKVREEAIPQDGLRVQITRQRIRWTDGKTYIWKGRKVLTGKGEADSGLRFDYLSKSKS